MSLDSDCEWCGPDCNGESHSKPWVPGDHLKWGTSALGGTARVTHVRYDGWIRVEWDCGRFDEQWHSPSGWSFAVLAMPQALPFVDSPCSVLGIQMELWESHPTVDFAIRYGHAPGIVVTHQYWHGTHSLVIDWQGRKTGLGCDPSPTFEGALSNMRRNLVHVGRNVFGGVPLPWEQP